MLVVPEDGEAIMTEGILIEISHRFRKLEDHIEAADLFLASFKSAAERRIEKADAAHDANEITYADYCRRVNEPMADIEKLNQVRADIESALERCREDLVSMQEKIRRP